MVVVVGDRLRCGRGVSDRCGRCSLVCRCDVLADVLMSISLQMSIVEVS